MKKLKLVLAAGALTLGSAAWADTVTNSGNGGFVAFNATGAFWNNTSSDIVNGSNAANVGNFLNPVSGSAFNGGVSGCSACGTNYMTGGGQMDVQSSNIPNFVSGFNFVRQAGALSITLLYANSGVNGNVEVGIYDATSGTTALNNHTILFPNGNIQSNLNPGPTFGGATSYPEFGSPSGTTTLQNGSPYANWGIYVRECTITGDPTCGGGSKVVTQFFNVAFNQNDPGTDTGHQHFALFQAGTNLNTYFVGFEDQTAGTGGVEGYGDYNDIILQINTSQSLVAGVPEPGTLAFIGAGLAGLGLLKRKIKK
jgi:hypothetical protein